jgi:hypothetical protein
VHLSGRDVDDALLAVYGMKKTCDNDKASQLSPTDCPRCKEPNEYSNVFCKKCGWVLDKTAAVTLDEKRKKADEILNALTKDPESLKVIAQALAKLGLVDKLKEIRQDGVPSSTGRPSAPTGQQSTPFTKTTCALGYGPRTPIRCRTVSMTDSR